MLVSLWALLLAAIDIEHHRLPNVLTVSGMIAGLVVNVVWYLTGESAVTMTPGAGWQGVWHGSLVDPAIWAGWEAFAPTFSPLHSILGIVVGGGVLWFIAMISRGGMGGGDVKFLAAIGAFLGPGAALLTLFIGALLGSVVGIGLIIFGRLQRRQPIPFGPFLAAGVLTLALLG
jgi:prepilin signal peptidase PulO-like enzyme (type II secretory pathway)